MSDVPHETPQLVTIAAFEYDDLCRIRREMEYIKRSDLAATVRDEISRAYQNGHIDPFVLQPEGNKSAKSSPN